MNNEYVVAQIKEMLNLGDDDKIVLHKVKKNNKQEFDACLINKKGETFAPNIYYDAGNDDDDIIEEICRIYENEAKNKKFADGLNNRLSEILNDKEKAVASIYPLLINKERNKEILETLVHRPYLNLETIYYIDLNGGTVKITYELANRIGITPEEIHVAAMDNLANENTVIENIVMFLKDKIPFNPFGKGEEPPMWVITADDFYNGANRLLCPKKFEKVAEKIGNRFYIIPSSIHELICVPINNQGINELVYMIKQVNETELSPIDFLANALYKFDDGKITVVKEVA